jgi:hypothetical protein
MRLATHFMYPTATKELVVFYEYYHRRFEVFTVVTMMNAVFWDMAPFRYFVNRRFGGTYRFHLQGISNPRAMNVYSHLLTLVHRSRITYNLKMEATGSSERSVNKISTRRHNPEDCILHYHHKFRLSRQHFYFVFGRSQLRF